MTTPADLSGQHLQGAEVSKEIERDARVEAAVAALGKKYPWMVGEAMRQTRADIAIVLAAADEAAALPDAAGGGEAVGALFQHGETGRTRVVLRDQVADCDARWFKVGDLALMTHPAPAPAVPKGCALVPEGPSLKTQRKISALTKQVTDLKASRDHFIAEAERYRKQAQSGQPAPWEAPAVPGDHILHQAIDLLDEAASYTSCETWSPSLIDEITSFVVNTRAMLSAAPCERSEPVPEVWEATTKTGRMLFATEPEARAWAGQFPASVAGGIEIHRVQVYRWQFAAAPQVSQQAAQEDDRGN